MIHRKRPYRNVGLITNIKLKNVESIIIASYLFLYGIEIIYVPLAAIANMFISRFIIGKICVV